MPIGCTVSIHHVWSIEATLAILGVSKSGQVQSVQNGTTKITHPRIIYTFTPTFPLEYKIDDNFFVFFFQVFQSSIMNDHHDVKMFPRLDMLCFIV